MKIVFFAHAYWELHWMYRVIKTLNAPVYTDDEETRRVALDSGFEVLDIPWNEFLNLDHPYEIVVTTNMHIGQNRSVVEAFFSKGKKAILMQHAWDSDLNFLDKFWNYDMSRFSYYLVGSTQDEEWLGKKHGEKIINTGIPHLDDLCEVSREKKTREYITDIVGTSPYFLSMIPDSGVHGSSLRDEYFNLSHSHKIFFKIHPGGNHQTTAESLKSIDPTLICLPDPHGDPKFTYRLMNSSSGVICYESFMTVEASLLKRPVISPSPEKMDQSFYNREENSLQKDRVPDGMASPIEAPQYNPIQDGLAKLYQCDGHNTERVVNFLYRLIKE